MRLDFATQCAGRVGRHRQKMAVEQNRRHARQPLDDQFYPVPGLKSRRAVESTPQFQSSVCIARHAPWFTQADDVRHVYGENDECTKPE